MKTIAITHAPSPRMTHALRTFIDVQPIDLEVVRAQHRTYQDALRRAGVTVIELTASLDEPDAVFIEDTAIVLDELAILTSMGAPSRRAEVPGVEAELRRHRKRIERITLPATIEGGDVLRVGRTLFVGATGRTNEAGFEALRALAPEYAVRRVPVRDCLHLKTACTALPDGTILFDPRWLDPSDLGGAPTLAVAEDGAANVVLANGRVIMSAAFPRTIELVHARGFEVDPVDLSELAKAEGSATCLSLLVTHEPSLAPIFGSFV